MKLTNAQMQAILAAMIDTGGPFDPLTTFVGVGTAISDQGAATLRADITAAPGTAGTATAVTTWSAPHQLMDGRWAVDAPVKSFKVASVADSCILNVWYIASLATLGVLLGYDVIYPPVELTDEFSLYSLVVRLTVDPDGRWSAEIGWNG